MTALMFQLRDVDLADRAAIVDRGIEALICALLAFMPFAMGVVAPWSEQVVIAGAVLIALGLLLRRLFDPTLSVALSRLPGPILMVVLAFAAMLALQLIPLPAGAVGWMAPQSLSLRHRLLADLPGVNALLAHVTLSFYPPATRHDLRVVLVATVVFLAVVDVVRTDAQVRRLLAWIACVGGAVVLLALVQDISGTDRVFWTYPNPYGRAAAGPFVNYGTFGQFVNLSIGAAAGLLLLRVEEIRRARRRVGPSVTGLRLDHQVSAWESREVWALCLMIVAAAVTLFLSMSRGGMVALMVAGSITLLLVARRRHFRAGGWVAIVAGLAIFMVLLYAGFDAVADRLATLYKNPDPSAGRFQTYQDLAVEWRRFPLLGTGLGTHSFVYPMFDRSANSAMAEYADSDWFQLAEETGAVGLALVLAFVAMIGFHLARAVRARRPAICVVSLGLLYGLLAVVLHSFTDFGQHLPAVGCLSAVFCGLTVNLSRMAREAREAESDSKSSSSSPARLASMELAGLGVRPALAGLAVPLVVLGTTGWALASANTARAAADHADRAADAAATLAQNNWIGDDEQYVSLLTDASAAAELEPDDVDDRYRLAAWRWHALSHPADAAAARVALPPEAADLTRRIVADLHAARALCPTYGPPLSLAGQLELFALHDPAGAAHVRAGYALWPTHPFTCFAAAMADAHEGRWDDAMAKFHRCEQLDESLFPQIIATCAGELDRPDLAVTLCDRNPTLLLQTWRFLSDAKPAPGTPAAEALKRLIATMNTVKVPKDSPAWVLFAVGQFHWDEHDLPAAEEYMRLAINKQYGEPDWHRTLAYVYAAQKGRTMDAALEARRCLRLRASDQLAKLLLDELKLRPDFDADQ